ncbi:flavin reductase family protein [Clostridium sp. AN503]|uniref:flavin reductase family protein n=1 Tax=Clostridium sp. AN503 TaxID=3160598 RepID=UPI0034584A11
MSKITWRGGNMLYPVPAVMVSCQRPGERPNIITVAWAGTVCSTPAMLSISVRKERYSYDIIKETGNFVVNLVNRDLVFATDYCGVKSGRDTDKFAEMKLTAQASEHIDAPGILESPLNLECRVTQVIPLGSHDMFLAEIVGVTVDERYMDEKGTFHLNDAGLVAYSHGTYFELGDKLGTFGYSVKKLGRKVSSGRLPADGKPATGDKSRTGGKSRTGEKPATGGKPATDGKSKSGKKATTSGKSASARKPSNHTGRRKTS